MGWPLPLIAKPIGGSASIGVMRAETQHQLEALGRAARGAGARIHGPIAQGALLRQLGIEARAAALQANGSEEQRASIAAALERLIGDGPTGMGTMFKAMGLSAPQVKALPGFDR